MKPKTCRTCGKPTQGAQCGACSRARISAAMLGYKYQRTHVCVRADGTRTIEAGRECGEACA